MQDLLEIFILAYKKLSAENIVLFLLLIKIGFCALGGLTVTYVHSKFSYKWLRNNYNIYVGITLPVIGLVITTVIGSNIALSIGMIGALSIVRFRTPIRTPYELVHYFSLLTIGISAKVDLSITVVLIILLSILPYFIKRFSLIKDNTSGSDGKLSLNFQGLMKENDFKKIHNELHDRLVINQERPFTTIPEAMKEIDDWKSKEDITDKQIKMLNEYDIYLKFMEQYFSYKDAKPLKKGKELTKQIFG